MKRGNTAIALGVALISTLCFTASASAEYDPLGSGQTKLTLDKGFLALLKSHGVKVEAKAPAKLKATTLTTPVLAGEMDPITGKGTIEGEGTLVFSSGNRKVPFRDLVIKAKKAPLYAKVGGGQLKVAQAKTIASKREGFGEGFSAKGLYLTQKVAVRLNKKLRLGKTLKEGQPFGSLKSQTQPHTVNLLPQGKLTLIPAQAMLAKLHSLFVSLNPIAPAELAPGPLFNAPIALGSAIAPDASSGTLRSAGAIELLQLGAGQIFLTEFWVELASRELTAEVNIQPTPAFPGKLGRLGVFGMGAGALSSDPKGRTIEVSGAPLTLSASTAAQFNQAFAEGKADFGAGEVFGVVSFGAVGE